EAIGSGPADRDQGLVHRLGLDHALHLDRFNFNLTMKRTLAPWLRGNVLPVRFDEIGAADLLQRRDFAGAVGDRLTKEDHAGPVSQGMRTEAGVVLDPVSHRAVDLPGLFRAVMFP